jgi:proteasome accessory factor B
LINLIAALLEAERPMTAEEIRTRIAGYDRDNHEAFRRIFERDKADLKTMGIPLETRQLDPFGDTPPGYIIPKSRYYLPELDLEADELAALRIAAGAVLGIEAEAGSGVLKLSMGASSTVTADGARLAWNADVAAAQPLLGPLYSAVSERVPVSFGYRPTGADEADDRTIEPYALVHRRGHWYLVGRDRRSDATRTFKVARIIGNVRRGEGTYEVPADFDAHSHLAVAGLPVEDEAVVATLRFDSSLRWWPEQNLTGAATREGPGGSLEVDMPVASFDSLASYAVWWGTKVEIVGPPAARARMAERLAAARASGR